MITPDIHTLNCNTISDKYIRKHYPEFADMVDCRYPGVKKMGEKVWMWSNGMDKKPVCPVCGGPVPFLGFVKGYQRCCSLKCACNDPEYIKKKSVPVKDLDSVNAKRRKTVRERYGVDNVFQSEKVKSDIKESLMERYGVDHPMKSKEIQEKTKNTFHERYGVDNIFQSEEIKKKIADVQAERYGGIGFASKELADKTRKTCEERYGSDNYARTGEFKDKFKETCLERYGAPYYTQTEDYKKKSHDSKKLHGTFNTSKIKEDFSAWLDENGINYVRQYRSDKYPFNCDFYFPDRDMYLEINGSWTHGFHPYDPDSPEDQKTLGVWKSKDTDYYDNAIDVWTVKDPLKVRTARENGVDLRIVYSCNIDDVIGEYLRL